MRKPTHARWHLQMTAGLRAPGLVSSPRQFAAVLLSLALAAAGLWLDRVCAAGRQEVAALPLLGCWQPLKQLH